MPKPSNPLFPELGALRVMVPAERELRADLRGLANQGSLQFLPHEGWLSTAEQFRESDPKAPPWKMDTFYRLIRRTTGILMEGEKPVGGKYSFDKENRLPWHGRPSAPNPPLFPGDPIKEEVGGTHPEGFPPSSRPAGPGCAARHQKDAEKLWSRAKAECLPLFGPYEDAMSHESRGLFHTRVSSLLNIHRLLPSRLISDVIGMNLPLGSREGFIRQILGWREFVHHVHESTDGFRNLPGGKTPVEKSAPEMGAIRCGLESPGHEGERVGAGEEGSSPRRSRL